MPEAALLMTSRRELIWSVRGDDLDPGEVTAALGVQPDRAWSKGDRMIHRRPPAAWALGAWSIATRRWSESENFEDHAQALLAVLVPKVDFVEELQRRPGIYIILRFALEWTGEPYSSDIAPLTIRQLSGLASEITVSVYPPSIFDRA